MNIISESPDLRNSTIPVLHGGLGNMLFQIAASYSYCLKNHKELVISTQWYRQSLHKPPIFYQSNIFSKLFIQESIDFSSHGISLEESRLYKNHSFEYEEIPSFEGLPIFLDGYFQNERFFSEHKDEIVDLFEFDCGDNLLNGFDPQNSCSIHVRRGDFVNLKHLHPSVDLEYIKSALSLFDPDSTFVLFSDDFSWCEENCTPESLGVKDLVIVPPHLTDIQSLYLMKSCANNIIANSSFSWWGAYLNTNPNKKVVAPSKWFTQSYADLIGYDLKEHSIIPKEWIKI
jgi:hypothetical protein